MSRGPARIDSADVIRQLRIQYSKFDQAARNALMGCSSDVSLTADWLRGEQQLHWKHLRRRCEEDVNRARSELSQAEWKSSRGDTRSSCIEEQRALRRAKERLEEAERGQAATARWAVMLDQKVRKMLAPVNSLSILLDTRTPQVMARLDVMIQGLEAYFRPAPTDVS